ncbi:hypothetical protein, partial [Ralstonia pseudosolanacearum]|uniref:hypothetical protein n=1 Tax=Ralstonia pseudosolanacearum TaxID=1310165 RepID=UPI003CFB61BC
MDIAAVRQYLRAGIATLLHCAPDTVTDQANLIQLGLVFRRFRVVPGALCALRTECFQGWPA